MGPDVGLRKLLTGCHIISGPQSNILCSCINIIFSAPAPFSSEINQVSVVLCVEMLISVFLWILVSGQHQDDEDDDTASTKTNKIKNVMICLLPRLIMDVPVVLSV